MAIFTIAIGIGANTALFSVYDLLVLNPVSIPRASSLVAIWTNNTKLGFNAPALSWPRYQEIRAHARSFSSVGVSAFDNFTLTGNGDPEQLTGLRVSSTFLSTLGVLPASGRNFTDQEDFPHGPAVCILSHDLWVTRFGTRPGIVGESIVLNGQPWQVVGIMPPRVSAPFGQVQVFAPRVFEVSGLTAVQVNSGAGYTQPIGRLAPGVSIERAASELEALDRSYRARFAGRLDAENSTVPRQFVEALVGTLRPTFYTLLGAVGFVLMIACANVASLFLSRLTARHKEIAVRLAVGASRGHLVRQFLTETVAFSIVAGTLGVLLAYWSLAGIQAIVTSQLPQGVGLTLNWRAMGFTGLVTLLTALSVGLLPSLHASRAHLVEALKDSARGSSSAGGARSRAVLIVVEVALSVVLLVGSSLLLISFLRLQHTAPGFEPRGAASAFVGVPTGRYPTPVQQARFFTEVVDRLRENPQVVAAAAGLGLPVSGFNPRFPYSVGGRPVLPLPQRALANLAIVTEDYFKTMRISLLAGRSFTSADRDDAPKVCILNDSLARRLFPGESALGKVILRGQNADVAAEIVGVIRDVKTNGVNVQAPDEVYYSVRQMGQPLLSIVARTTGDPAALESIIRSAVARVDRNQPISFFTTLEASLASSLGAQRIVASLTAVFAGLALLLSAVGLYTVLAHAVSSRTPEIGIRMALGARPQQVVGLVFRDGLGLAGIGLGLGLAGAAGVAQLIRTLLFEVHPLDPIVYVGVSILLAAVAALACLVPSARAARIDPLRALQTDVT